MKAIFFTITDYPNSIMKHYTANTAEISIQPYEPVNDLDGFIITSKLYYDYNYVKLSWEAKDSMDGNSDITIERYYFITSKELMTGERLKMNLHEDVLQTFADSIYKLPAIVGRTQSGYINANLVSDMPTENFKETEFLKIGSELAYDSSHLVLVTSGGGTVST